MKLALGTVQFGLPYGVANEGGQVSRDEAARITAVARDNDIHVLDTAISYGDAENCIGSLDCADFRIVTKLPEFRGGTAEVESWVRKEVSGSLDRLRIGKLYGLLLHRSHQIMGPAGAPLVRALDALKREGLVENVGVSIYSPDELGPLLDSFAIDMVQAPLNLVDRRMHTSGWIEKLHRMRIRIHARSVFLQGLLLMPRRKIPPKFELWSHLWEAWHGWLGEQENVNAVQACLGFSGSYDEVEAVVLGVDSVNQLNVILEAANHPHVGGWPDIRSDDERLINPYRWSEL